MPASDPIPPAKRGIRLLRLMAATSVIIAVFAIVSIVRGDGAGKSHALIVAAIAIGTGALLGMAFLTLPYIHRRKDQNDTRP